MVSSIADRMQVSKSDILNAESGTTNPAVKLALAETHVIQETKKYLEEVLLNDLHCVTINSFFRPPFIRTVFRSELSNRA